MRENEISGADFHSPVVITLEMAVEALDYAVQSRGEDYVYPPYLKDEFGNCQYVVDGEPACVVGVALDHLGVALVEERLSNLPAHALPRYWGLDVVDYENHLVGDFLLRAQQLQDKGLAWGEAVAQAKEEVVYPNAREDN